QGRGQLTFQDRLEVELFRGTGIELSEARLDPADSIFIRLKLNFGHTRTELDEKARARVTLETDYATIRALDDGTEFLTCHAPELTCLMTVTGQTEVEAQGVVVTVPAGYATYIFPNEPPKPAIEGQMDQISQWLDRKRGTGEIEPLGAVVDRWIKEVETVTPDLPLSEGMVRVGPGPYPVGRAETDDNHIQVREITVDEFWIDQYEVTNAEYQLFLAENSDYPPPAGWPAQNFPADQADYPVQGVSWAAADAYCKWDNKRLPAEAEWEIAARGTDSRLFPWGDNQDAVNLPQSGTYRVGSKLTNQSPFGVFDMAGNVWEWVGEPYAEVAEGHRILRGGANDLLRDMAYRLAGDPGVPTMVAMAGLRCAADQVIVVEPTAGPTGGTDILYQDTFADPGSNWPIQAEGNLFFGYHPPDFYHVEVGAPDSATIVSRRFDVDDATVETEVLVDHTTTTDGDFRYGLALRRIAEDRFYAFTVSSRSGTWSVLKAAAGQVSVLAEGTVDTLRGFAPQGFTPNTTDSLRVDAKGPNFVFYINDQQVAAVSDSDYPTGEVGFYVENFAETLAHVHFDALTIRKVADIDPALTDSGTESPPAAEPTPALSCTVATTALNLRQGPGTVYVPLAVLPEDTRLVPLARNDEGTWIQVRMLDSDQTGWISAFETYLSCNVPILDLPVG
ncbi:MAG: SUMF1/EgtB/PvdO family nonheme iron enzyme, partial [Anaerolineae bacterium]|nr:SUMF1/EgtB/PvdO family nonheme iron enzyme [Anaerolineae bacterium]